MSWELSLEERLISCPERPLGIQLPVPLSARLGVLAKIGYYAWAPTTRKEVVSALLLAASTDGKKLSAIVRRYEGAHVVDAFVEGFDEWRFLYPPGSPGPQVHLTLGFAGPEPPPKPPWASPEDQLSTTRTYRIGMAVASPLAGRLDLLVDSATEAGHSTTRADLTAALILAATTDGNKLARQLARYWHGTVADATIDGLPTDRIVRPTSTRAGKPQRKTRTTRPAGSKRTPA